MNSGRLGFTADADGEPCLGIAAAGQGLAEQPAHRRPLPVDRTERQHGVAASGLLAQPQPHPGIGDQQCVIRGSDGAAESRARSHQLAQCPEQPRPPEFVRSFILGLADYDHLDMVSRQTGGFFTGQIDGHSGAMVH